MFNCSVNILRRKLIPTNDSACTANKDKMSSVGGTERLACKRTFSQGSSDHNSFLLPGTQRNRSVFLVNSYCSGICLISHSHPSTIWKRKTISFSNISLFVFAPVFVSATKKRETVRMSSHVDLRIPAHTEMLPWHQVCVRLNPVRLKLPKISSHSRLKDQSIE